MSDCPFCKRITADEYEISDRFAVAFAPLNPVTSGHLLVVPREHVADAGSSPLAASRTMSLAAEIAGPLAWADSYNLITSAGAAATQSVRHLHIHLVPRRAGDGLALPWTGQQRAQLDPGSAAGSPGLSQDTREAQTATEPLSASLTDGQADRTGRAAYAAYARLRAEQMADGRVYPAWDELDLTERFAWEAAGAAGLDDGASAVAAAERAKLQPAIDRVQHLATAAQAKAIEHAVAGERERCAVLAEAREATYDLTRPCGCGRTNPYSGRPCTALIRSGQPFADLIREQPS